MDLATSPATLPREKVLKFERLFEAPPELVFALWSDPQHIVRWWGPEGFALAQCEMDFQEGGLWRFCMKQQATGFEHRVHGKYVEISKPDRLSFTYVNEDDGHEMLVEVMFSAHGPNTLMRFQQAHFLDVQERDAHGYGWNSTFDLLTAYLLRFDGIEVTPIGRPRGDGVADDLVAARNRPIAELEASGKNSRGPAGGDLGSQSIKRVED